MTGTICLPGWSVYALLTLLLFLWGVGGIGWKGNFESKTDHTVSLLGAWIIYVFWPAFALVAGVAHTLDTWRREDGAA